MPRSKLNQLSSFFRTSSRKPTTNTSPSASTPPSTPPSAVKPRASSSPSTSTAALFRSVVKSSSSSEKIGDDDDDDDDVSGIILRRLCGPPSASASDYSKKHIASGLSSILCGSATWEFDDDSTQSKVVEGVDNNIESESDRFWFSNLFSNSMSLHRKDVCRVRKFKWIFKNTQKERFDKLVSMCLKKVGSSLTFDVLVKLGRVTGLKEYNAFIQGCIKTARICKDEKAQMKQILNIYRVLQLMKESGFVIDEETCGPFLLYLIEMRLTDQFFLFLEIIKDEDADLHPRLGYYEMLLWIELDNEEKIQEVCHHICSGESEVEPMYHENYLMALCERNRMKELCQLLGILDITRVSSFENLTSVFQALGRLSLEHFSEVFIQALKDSGYGAQSISDLIYYYSSSMKYLEVEDVLVKFKEMHQKMDVELLPGSYEKLVEFCCASLRVHMALDIVDEMSEAGFKLSTKMLNLICRACEDTAEYLLARRIQSMLHPNKLKPNSETFRIMINLYVRMKDFGSAYAMLKDIRRFNLEPSASMYNPIIAGFYREKKMSRVLKVLQDMKEADIKPDSQTFSLLTSYSTSEEEITKYFEEIKAAGVHATKHIFMALINAYAACGQIEKAKQVVLEKGIPTKYYSEIKSVLVSSLASHGHINDALNIYKEITQSGCCVEPKAIVSLIEHSLFVRDISLLLGLLEAINDKRYWVDGCYRILLLCVRNKELRSAVDLMKKLADHFQDDELAREVMFDEVFLQVADMESPDIEIGISLLEYVKKGLNLSPSRKSLDFLLSACVSTKNLQKAQFIWKEYEIAGLPYNIFSYLRMYQAYLATGCWNAATKLLSKIPKSDPHAWIVIQACDVTYGKPKGKKKKKET